MEKVTVKAQSLTIITALLAAALVAFSVPAQAQLIDLRFGGSSWSTTTISSTPYTVVGSNADSNSVFAGNASGIVRYDSTSTSPTVGVTYSGVNASQIAIETATTNFAFANLGSSMVRLRDGDNLTATVSSTSWNTISQATGAQNVFGLTSNGEIGRVFYNGSTWVTQTGTTLGNSTTGYTSIASDGQFDVGRMMYSSGGGNGLDRTFFNGTSWVFNDNISAANYNLLTMANTGLENRVFGANTSGLDYVFFNGTSWQTTSVNSKQYNALVTDLDQTYVLFGLTSSGVDKIFSTDSGDTWTTTEILSGTFTGIADNAGVVDAVYLIPEPSSAALILGAGGLALLLRRRRSR
jgi:hypothetical protein